MRQSVKSIDTNFIKFVVGESDEITSTLSNQVSDRINSRLLPIIVQDCDGYQRGNSKEDNVDLYMYMSKEERRQKLNNYPNLFNILLRDLINLKLAEDGLEAVSISMDANFGVDKIKQLLEVTHGL